MQMLRFAQHDSAIFSHLLCMSTQSVCHSEEPQARRNLALRLKRFRARFLHFVQDRLFAALRMTAKARNGSLTGTFTKTPRAIHVDSTR